MYHHELGVTNAVNHVVPPPIWAKEDGPFIPAEGTKPRIGPSRELDRRTNVDGTVVFRSSHAARLLSCRQSSSGSDPFSQKMTSTPMVAPKACASPM